MGSSLALDQNFLCMLFRLCDFFRNFFSCHQKFLPSFFWYFATTNVQIFRHYETVENSHFLFFCKIFQVSLQFFEILQQNGCLKNLKVPPFTVFGIVRFFKSNNFCLKRFSQAQHAISDFCFFKDRCFFYATFFLICFHRSPQFLLETKRFASIKHCSRFSALCDLPETFIKKIFEKFRKVFSSIFCFFEGLRLRKMGFLLFPVAEELFSRFMGIPSGFFGAVKLMKF